MNSELLSQLLTDLTDRKEEVRVRSGHDLSNYVQLDLRELSQEDVSSALDQLIDELRNMLCSTANNVREGALLAINILIDADAGLNLSTRLARLIPYLQDTLDKCNDDHVLRIAVETTTKMVATSVSLTTDLLETEVKRAFGFLAPSEKSEFRRFAGVLILKELATLLPTLFYQQTPQFFDYIFLAIRDSKEHIRENAAIALRTVLAIMSGREFGTVGMPYYYKQCFEEVEREYDDSTKKPAPDEFQHGSLLILLQLLTCCNAKVEEKFREEENILDEALSHKPKYTYVRDTSVLEGGTSRGIWHSARLRSVQSSVDLLDKGISSYDEPTSQIIRTFMNERFARLCVKVLKVKSSKSSFIHSTLLSIIPRLAAFNLSLFTTNSLHDTAKYLFSSLKHKDRSATFISLGLLATALGTNILRLEGIFKFLEDALQYNPRKRSSTYEPALFSCITMLCLALKSKGIANSKAEVFVNAMFSCGLSSYLVRSMESLCSLDDKLKKHIQLSLIRLLHNQLVGRPLQHPSLAFATDQFLSSLPPGSSRSLSSSIVLSSPSVSSASSSTLQRSSGQGRSIGLSRESEVLTLALRTLRSFDFDCYSLSQLVYHCSETYLTHENKEVRIEAIKTCSKLLGRTLPTRPSLEGGKNGMDSLDSLTYEVLSKILSTAVVDEDADVRYCALVNLESRFDSCLAQSGCLGYLSSCLNDEDPQVREVSVCIVGRVCLNNPSFVMPFLRKLLIRILTELEFSGVDRNKVQSARLLAHLVRCSPGLIVSYVEPILDVVLPKLKKSETLAPIVVVSLLTVLGDLVQVSGALMKKWLDDIILILIDIMQEKLQTSKQEVALWTLGQMVENTGYVVEPYLKYPNLLEVLLKFFKTEQNISTKKEAIRVLGILGALDPHLHKGISGQGATDFGAVLSIFDTKNDQDQSDQDLNTTELLVNMSPTSTLEDYYPAVSIAVLMRLVRNPSLVQHHNSVVMAISTIFKSLGLKCVPYLNQVLPAYVQAIRTTYDWTFRETLFSQIGIIVGVVKQHVRPYLDDIFLLIKEYWSLNASTLTLSIIDLLERIVEATDCEFRANLIHLIPLMLQVLNEDNRPDRAISVRLMRSMQIFGKSLEDYLHFLLPSIISIFDNKFVSDMPRKVALETVDALTQHLDLTDFASRILHALVRTLDTAEKLRPSCLDLLCSLALQLNQRFHPYARLVVPVLTKNRIQSQRFELIYQHISKRTLLMAMEEDGQDCKVIRWSPGRTQKNDQSTTIADPTSSTADQLNGKLRIDAQQLQKAWMTSKRVSRDDWLEWLRRFSLELLKESPSPALRTVCSLANDYNPLARELFNAAFVSCWLELDAEQQKDLVKNLETAFSSSDAVEITQAILNLSEFMEHSERGPLPLDLKILSECAVKCRAYAKALHFNEEEFHKRPTNQILESLISINNKLQQPEAAIGILEYARKHHKADLKVQERWYEKLHEWSRALVSYERQQEKNPDDESFMLGRMRCLEALGEWGKLHEITVEKWPLVGDGVKENMARMAATAAWGLGHWKDMETYVAKMQRNTYDSFFYQSVVSLHYDNFELAQKAIEQARNLLITELSTLVGESYSRAYGVMVNVQMLSELDEVIQYKQMPEKREVIREIWWNRLRGCQNILEDWQRLLQIRSLVVDPKEDVRAWLKYAGLCRKNNRTALAGRTLTMLLGEDPNRMEDEALIQAEPRVVFACLKHLWNDPSEKKQQEAFRRLQLFVNSLAPVNEPVSPPKDINILIAKCFLKLGKWHGVIHGRQESSAIQAVSYYNEATKQNKDWAKAWHSFAYANYEVVAAIKQSKSTPEAGSISLPEDVLNTGTISDYCKASIRGYFQSIALSSTTSSLQDTLRLLTLWFEYGNIPEVNAALVDGIKSIQIDNWIQVIPQLIARIDTSRPLVGRLVIQLLRDIGKHHPQALIYPLTVVSKSQVPSRNQAANAVLKSMREHSNLLVQQALLVSEELIRVAILWHELWHEGLEEASRLYFGEKNIPGMLAVLEPLHQMLQAGAQTLKETAFIHSYGHDLNSALECCRRFQATRNVKELTQAWDFYYHVFRRITKQLPQLTSLELQYVSPKLLDCRDLELSVPGTYDPGQPAVNIHRVQSNLNVISSKQRPRKLSIFGSNGQEYQFLLKGHEDLRQDERVMQLFGLVNSILLNNQQTPKRNLSIQRYSVIPLSTNSGLIGWVPNCDTLHSLIRDYREKKKILLNIEHRLMLRMAPDYDHLMLMHKVEVFEHALESTSGDDLAQILWIKSPSSEVWFDRRTNYTRSLAVMSMVGYVLGLGDRHPSNLMLDRVSGKIMHIDFGDCFEVAMTREKFPEKIPFRLTRMLVNAMEVTGIDGNYRLTCENVMKVLRNHKDSLMAVLEAFVYDPLLNWRLMEANIRDPRSRGPSISSQYSMPANAQDGFSSLDHSYASLKRIHESSTEGDNPPEELNKKAVSIINRVRDKLTGRDFGDDGSMVDVATQVSRLVEQATSHENLCQCYIGWCPFW